MHNTIPENITAAKAKVKIVIIIFLFFLILILCYLIFSSAKLTLFYRIEAAFAKKYKCNKHFLMCVNYLLLTLKMTIWNLCASIFYRV